MKQAYRTLLITALGLTSSLGANALLTPAQSSRLKSIMEISGIKENAGKLQGFDIICEALSFGNNECLIASEPQDPAAHRVAVPRDLSGEFWSLLKKAGAKQFVSGVADGTAGRLLITAESLTCGKDAESAEQCELVPTED